MIDRAARRGESSRCGCPWARPKPRPTGGAHRERIDNRYAAVNVRLTGRGAGSGATTAGMSSPVCSADELLLITFSLQSCPTSQTPKPGVSHVRLTERAGLRRQANTGADDSSQYPSEALDRREGGNVANLPAVQVCLIRA